MKKQLWIVCEINYGMLTIESWQMLTVARNLAKKMPLEISVIIPNEVKNQDLLIDEVGTRIFFCPDLQTKSCTECANVLLEKIDRVQAICILFIDNSFWKMVAVRMACQLNAGLVADCINILPNKEKDNFIYTRYAYSNSSKVDIISNGTSLGICTVKKNVFGDAFNKDNLIKYDCNFEFGMHDETTSAMNIHIIEKVALEEKDYLEGKKIIFGIGCGVDFKQYKKIEDIADRLNAGIGYSKPVIEIHGLSGINQVGQTGQCISCDIYIALGISGSVFHVSGLQNCKKIIAVNWDNNAQIASVADVTIIADVNEIIDRIYKIFVQ